MKIVAYRTIAGILMGISLTLLTPGYPLSERMIIGVCLIFAIFFLTEDE